MTTSCLLAAKRFGTCVVDRVAHPVLPRQQLGSSWWLCFNSNGPFACLSKKILTVTEQISSVNLALDHPDFLKRFCGIIPPTPYPSKKNRKKNETFKIFRAVHDTLKTHFRKFVPRKSRIVFKKKKQLRNILTLAMWRIKVIQVKTGCRSEYFGISEQSGTNLRKFLDRWKKLNCLCFVCLERTDLAMNRNSNCLTYSKKLSSVERTQAGTVLLALSRKSG